MASRLQVSREDFAAAWTLLAEQMAGDQLERLPGAGAAEMLAGEMVLAGRPIPVLVMRHDARWFGALRARRMWRSAWALAVRDIPTAWPIAMMVRRGMPLAGDGVVVLEHPDGERLDRVDLDRLTVEARRELFRRLGRTVRRIDRTHLEVRHLSAADWIVVDDPLRGPVPMLLALAQVRGRRGGGFSIGPLLVDLKRIRQYTPQDSLALCRGYAPYARLEPEPDAQDERSQSQSPAPEGESQAE